MTAAKLPTQIPRVLLTRAEAAASLGVSPNFFDEHMRPDLKAVTINSLTLFPVRELERWATQNAEALLPDRKLKAA